MVSGTKTVQEEYKPLPSALRLVALTLLPSPPKLWRPVIATSKSEEEEKAEEDNTEGADEEEDSPRMA